MRTRIACAGLLALILSLALATGCGGGGSAPGGTPAGRAFGQLAVDVRFAGSGARLVQRSGEPVQAQVSSSAVRVVLELLTLTQPPEVVASAAVDRPAENETATVVMGGIPPGSYLLVLQARDSEGNAVAHGSLAVAIEAGRVATVQPTLTPVFPSPSPTLSPFPPGTFLFTPTVCSGTVESYRVVSDGTVAPVDVEPGFSGPVSTAVDPTGRLLFASVRNDMMVQPFAIDATGGLQPGSPASLPFDTSHIVAHPTQPVLYVAELSSPEIHLFTHDSSGNLTDAGAINAGGEIFDLAVSPDGSLLFFTHYDGATTSDIFRATLDASGMPGPASAVVTSTIFADGFNTPALDPTGTFLYVTSNNPDHIRAYTNLTGAVTEIAGSPFTAGVDPFSMSFHPSGTALFVGNHGSGLDGSVQGFSRNVSTGALVSVSDIPLTSFSGGGFANDVAYLATSGGEFLYLALQGPGSLVRFDATSGGVLSNPTQVAVTGQCPNDIDFVVRP